MFSHKFTCVYLHSRYYAYRLCPLMQKAKDDGEDAKVMSVFAAGSGRAIDLDDLGLKKNFSLAGAARSAPTYNDCMIEVCILH